MPPTKRRARRQIQSYLEGRYGAHSERLIAELEKIAFGATFEEPSDIPGVVKLVKPTIGQRHEAIMDLLAYQHGRPKQSVDIEVDDRRDKWNPDKLTLIELQAMDQLARKAADPVLIQGEVIRVLPAVLSTTDGKVKPE